MLDNGDRIEVSQGVCGSWDVDASQSGWWDINTRPLYVSLPGKKPYLINLSQVECMVGEWNKDKTQYGIRIFYASGNSVWIGEDASKELLGHMGVHGEDAETAFNRAKNEK